jgi:hypothetical protein
MANVFIIFLSRFRPISQTTFINSFNGADLWVMKMFAVIMIVKRAFWISF